MLRSLRTLRSIPRIKDIALILGKHGFHQVADALQAPVRTRFRKLFKWEQREFVQQPERLRMALEELGPTFIKFGQVLSTRPDLVPVSYIEELGKLQDDVAAESFEDVRAVLEAELQQPLEECFSYVDEQPLGIASIAQVHRAKTKEGHSVVLKVRKRGIDRLVQQDLRVLHLLAEFLAGWRDLQLFDPEGVVCYFERSISRELNFEYERYNQLRIRRNLGANSKVYVPEVFVDYSTTAVLTTEFLAGEKLSSVRGQPLSVEKGRELGTEVTLSMLKQIFEHGFYHADPHPGNFILMEDGRIGLLDFGNVGKCTPQTLDDILLLTVALIRRNYEGIARWILKQGRPKGDIDRRELASELMDVLDPLYGAGLGDIKVGPLFNGLFEIVSRNRITIPARFVHIGRTMVGLDGVLRLCAPQLEILPAVKPYAMQVFRRRWSPESIFREISGETTELLSALRSYPGNFAEILARVAEGRIELRTEVPEVSRIEKRLDQIASRVPLALLLCGLFVSSSILLALGGTRAGAGHWPIIVSVSGFLAALLVAGRLFLKG